MSHAINMLFYTRNSGRSESEPVTIYLRIYVNGKRIEQSTNRYIERANWSAKAGQMKGNTAEAKVLNNYLNVLRNKVYTYEREMILDGKEITFQSFRDKWFGIDKKEKMLLEVFREHNEDVTKLVGKDLASGTLQRYKNLP